MYDDHNDREFRADRVIPVILKTPLQILFQGLKAPASSIITLVMGFLTICTLTSG
jgi:hypothetical protein